MSKKKYTYQSYDYSFLCNNTTDKWSVVLPRALRVAARTIGFDLTEVHPMDEPVGQLYWTDLTTTYEPVREGGWEVTFTAPVEEPFIDASTAATYTQESSDNSESTNISSWWVAQGPKRPPIYIRNAEQLAKMYSTKRKGNSTAEFFKKRNYFKKINSKRYGKKV